MILGHVQRGGTPTAYDRVLATRFGWHAVEAAHRGEFGMMTALRGTDITMVPLAEAVETPQDGPGRALRRGRVRAVTHVAAISRSDTAPGRSRGRGRFYVWCGHTVEARIGQADGSERMDHGGHGMTMDLPPFTLGRGLEFSGDPFFLVGCLLALGLYGWGVVRLRRRGDALAGRPDGRLRRSAC